MNLLISIALRHLLARKRQSFVSMIGIVLGVAFFLAISSLMQGSQKDFIARLIDNSPHITISDEYRNPRRQPLEDLYPKALVGLRHVKPLTETRGIRHYEQVLDYLRTLPGVTASPVLAGQGLVSFAGKDYAVTVNGMIPSEVNTVSTLKDHMVEGSIDNLIGNADGIVIGSELARKLELSVGDVIPVTATTNQSRTFKIVGIFRTGRQNYDVGQVFADLKRVQALMGRTHRANTIILKLADPNAALALSKTIEKRIGYQSVSWQEMSEDMMSTLKTRNMIMYTVVSAVLVVAAFGIYNVISTVVLEKQRDIAILKSMGFTAGNVRNIFVIQGVMLGLTGNALGLPLGVAMMSGLMRVKIRVPWGGPSTMPVDWGWPQFAIAGAFALGAAIVAAWLPARKAAKVLPVDILRGGMA